MLRTKFWKDVAAGLPDAVRRRHMAELERVERWELALDDAIQVGSRIKGAFARTFQTLRGAH